MALVLRVLASSSVQRLIFQVTFGPFAWKHLNDEMFVASELYVTEQNRAPRDIQNTLDTARFHWLSFNPCRRFGPGEAAPAEAAAARGGPDFRVAGHRCRFQSCNGCESLRTGYRVIKGDTPAVIRP
jgi:hypothetical protein